MCGTAIAYHYDVSYAHQIAAHHRVIRWQLIWGGVVDMQSGEVEKNGETEVGKNGTSDTAYDTVEIFLGKGTGK